MHCVYIIFNSFSLSKTVFFLGLSVDNLLLSTTGANINLMCFWWIFVKRICKHAQRSSTFVMLLVMHKKTPKLFDYLASWKFPNREDKVLIFHLSCFPRLKKSLSWWYLYFSSVCEISKRAVPPSLILDFTSRSQLDHNGSSSVLLWTKNILIATLPALLLKLNLLWFPLAHDGIYIHCVLLFSSVAFSVFLHNVLFGERSDLSGGTV